MKLQDHPFCKGSSDRSNIHSETERSVQQKRTDTLNKRLRSERKTHDWFQRFDPQAISDCQKFQRTPHRKKFLSALFDHSLDFGYLQLQIKWKRPHHCNVRVQCHFESSVCFPNQLPCSCNLLPRLLLQIKLFRQNFHPKKMIKQHGRAVEKRTCPKPFPARSSSHSASKPNQQKRPKSQTSR